MYALILSGSFGLFKLSSENIPQEKIVSSALAVNFALSNHPVKIDSLFNALTDLFLISPTNCLNRVV